MKRKIITFTTLLACAMLVMKFFINADSNVCSNSTTCSTSNGLAYVQIMRANTPTSLQVQNACYPNNSPNGSIKKI